MNIGTWIRRLQWPSVGDSGLLSGIKNTCLELPVRVGRRPWTLVLTSFVMGCTLGGAAASGVVGHETTHSTVGTVGGAVAGGVIGHELGK